MSLAAVIVGGVLVAVGATLAWTPLGPIVAGAELVAFGLFADMEG